MAYDPAFVSAKKRAAVKKESVEESAVNKARTNSNQEHVTYFMKGGVVDGLPKCKRWW